MGTMEWENQGSSGKNRLIKWQSQEVKWMVSFLHKPEIKELCLKLVSFLHKLETKINYAWNRFYFYTSLKQKQTMLEKVSMPLAWWLNSRYMPPKIQSIWKENGVKVQITRSRERLDWDFTRSKQRLELNGNVFHYFNEVDTLKELSSNTSFHGLGSLTQDQELCSDNLVSFFKELDTRQGTLLRQTLFHFLRSLTQKKNHAPTTSS